MCVQVRVELAMNHTESKTLDTTTLNTLKKKKNFTNLGYCASGLRFQEPEVTFIVFYFALQFKKQNKNKT